MRNARTRLSTYTPDDLEEGCSCESASAMPHRNPVAPTELPAFSTKRLRLNHHMLHVRITMSSGACASSRQNTNVVKGEGVSGSLAPRWIAKGPAVLTSVCVQADLSRCLMY